MSFDINKYKKHKGAKGDVSAMEDGAKRALERITAGEDSSPELANALADMKPKKEKKKEEKKKEPKSSLTDSMDSLLSGKI